MLIYMYSCSFFFKNNRNLLSHNSIVQAQVHMPRASIILFRRSVSILSSSFIVSFPLLCLSQFSLFGMSCLTFLSSIFT